MNICQSCLSNNVDQLGKVESPYVDFAYTLFHCQSCQTRQFDMDENPDFVLSDYYNQRSANAEYLKEEFSTSKLWKNEVRMIEKWLAAEPGSVLDVGCRTGDFLLHWPEDIRRYGIELSVHSAAAAADRGLQIWQGTLEAFDQSDSFDLVTAYALLEHIGRPRPFLEKLCDLVNEEGILAVMIPSYQTLKPWILEKLEVRWHMYSPPEHLTLYSRKFLDQFFAERGFHLAHRRYTSGGMFNPFRAQSLAGRGFGKLIWILDAYSPVNRLPIFDHMYSYYLKSKRT